MAKITTPPAPEDTKGQAPPPDDQAPPADPAAGQDAPPEATEPPASTQEPPAPEPPATTHQGGLVLLAPDGATSCTVDGVVYEVVDGEVEVDPAHAAALIESHGFLAAE